MLSTQILIEYEVLSLRYMIILLFPLIEISMSIIYNKLQLRSPYLSESIPITVKIVKDHMFFFQTMTAF